MVTISSSLRLAHALHFRLHRSSWIHRVHFAWGWTHHDSWEVVGGFNQPVWKILHKLDYCILLSFPVFSGEKKNTRNKTKKNPRDPIIYFLNCASSVVIRLFWGVQNISFQGNYDLMDIFYEGFTFAAFPSGKKNGKKPSTTDTDSKILKKPRGCGFLDASHFENRISLIWFKNLPSMDGLESDSLLYEVGEPGFMNYNLMLQKSGINSPVEVKKAVKIYHYLRSGFLYASKRWLGMGFLNHQQYRGLDLELYLYLLKVKSPKPLAFDLFFSSKTRGTISLPGIFSLPLGSYKMIVNVGKIHLPIHLVGASCHFSVDVSRRFLKLQF